MTMLQKCCSYQKSNKIKLCCGSGTAETLNWFLTSVLRLSFQGSFQNLLCSFWKILWKQHERLSHEITSRILFSFQIYVTVTAVLVMVSVMNWNKTFHTKPTLTDFLFLFPSFLIFLTLPQVRWEDSFSYMFGWARDKL